MAGFGQGPYGQGPYGIGDTGALYIAPAGWASSQFGNLQVLGGSFTQTRSIQGWQDSFVDFPTLTNYLQRVEPVGLASDQYGDALVAFSIRAVFPTGWESATFGLPTFAGFPQTRAIQGWDSLRFGNVEVTPLTLGTSGWLSEEFGSAFVAFRIRSVFPQGVDTFVTGPSTPLSGRTRIYNASPTPRPDPYPRGDVVPVAWDSLSVPVVNVYNQDNYVLPAHACPPGMGIPSVANV